MPVQLFKYLHPDRVDILDKARIRFSPPHAFNDPFELKPNIRSLTTSAWWKAQLKEMVPKVAKEEWAKLPIDVRSLVPFKTFLSFLENSLPNLEAESFAVAESFTAPLRSLLEAKFEELIGILCLTEKPDNLLMWAHYADSHQGFLIEVDPTNPFFHRRRTEADEFFYLRKVQYKAARSEVVLTEVDSLDTFMSKSIDWEYEQEWRMLVPLAEANAVITAEPTSIHLFSFPKTMIKSVRFGTRIRQEVKDKLLNLITSDREYDHVSLKQAIVDSEQYRVNFKDVCR